MLNIRTNIHGQRLSHTVVFFFFHPHGGAVNFHFSNVHKVIQQNIVLITKSKNYLCNFANTQTNLLLCWL